MKRVLVALLPLLLALGVLSAPAIAAKPAPTPSSITVDQTQVRYGDTVTFTTTFDSKARVSIHLYCAQGSTIVYSMHGKTDYRFPLATITGVSDTWDGSAATCTAALNTMTTRGTKLTFETLATTTFNVGGVA